MKPLLLLAFLPVIAVLIPHVASAQYNEFGQLENNGLIYSSKTMGQLKQIVDSLNLKFKVCDANPAYFSKSQTIAHYITLEGKNAEAGIKDIQNGLSFHELRKKYKRIEVHENLPLIRYRGKTYDGKEKIVFSSIAFDEAGEQSFDYDSAFAMYEGPLNGKWITQYYPHDDTPAKLYAFFITQEFQSTKIPLEYARWIQYADCLVDTSAQIFSKNALYQRYESFHYKEDAPNIAAFDSYIKDCVKKDSNFTLATDDATVKSLAEAAYTEAARITRGTTALEEYFEKHGDPERALELKRNRIVVGGCSMDQGPRIHALNIAKLSAETVKWEIFLRAHLDIMNDNFQRASDGSYAWGERQTYIKELEELDIQVAELLLGISLQISNPATNHYQGYIGRIGRALAEYAKPQQLETVMLQMIQDEKLDRYNRMMTYYLFLNYNYNLKDQQRQKDNEAKLKTAVRSFQQETSVAQNKNQAK